jgi:hypothetical protein
MTVLMISAAEACPGLFCLNKNTVGERSRALIHGQQSKQVAREWGADQIAIGDLADLKSLVAAAKCLKRYFICCLHLHHTRRNSERT